MQTIEALAPLTPRTTTRCLVCGFGEVRTDEVIDRGLVLLAECPRCEHRWTAAAPSEPSAPRRVHRVRRPGDDASPQAA